VTARARLVATVPALAPTAETYGPFIIGLPGRRMLAQRTDDELVVCALDDSFQAKLETATRFPAPWPRQRGNWAVRRCQP